MVVYTSPTTLPIDLHKHCLILYAIMIFITEVWSDLCKLTSKEFWPNSTWPYFSEIYAIPMLVYLFITYNIYNIYIYIYIIIYLTMHMAF